ncbi:MAG: hypothetical protein KIT00_05985 [Rhodospirillales bacterium]|nr:hypothetical protein [Rhodospirillales bacterium]
MQGPRPSFPTGSLWETIVKRTRHAIETGALRSIETEQRFVEDGGVRFVVRAVSSLAHKQEEKKQQREASPSGKGPRNPFLPYEEDLFVADLSPSHVLLLNKFNVMDHHLLIVTRHYEEQETVLTAADFAALAVCLCEIGGLGFYNSGVIAGASQPHKHLQLVPTPLASSGTGIPMEALFAAPSNSDTRVPGLPFRHGFASFDADPGTGAAVLGDALHASYRKLLDAVGIASAREEDSTILSTPYNLLVTPAWMLLVPRSRECFDAISINALGFAGSLFLRDPSQFEIVAETGPMSMLRHVGLP